MEKQTYTFDKEYSQGSLSGINVVFSTAPTKPFNTVLLGSASIFENDNRTSEPENVSLNIQFLEIFGICVAALTLISFVLCGNLFTIIVFIKTKQYKKNHNCYILSLASADFLRGFLMPVYLLFTLRPDYRFSLSECTIFLVLRHFFSDASLLSILLITLDRCWCIFHPFNYRLNQSRNKTAILIIVSWVIAFLIYGPILLLNNHVDTAYINASNCDTFVNRNGTTFTVLTCVETIAPLCILIGSNTAIYVALKKRWNIGLRRSVSTSDGSVHRLSGSSKDSDSLTRGGSPKYNAGRRFSYQHGIMEQSNLLNPFGTPLRESINGHSIRETTGSDSQLTLTPQTIPSRRIARRVSFDSSGLVRVNWNPCSITTKMVTNNNCRPLLRRRDSETVVKQILTKQDRKAARALVFIVVVFALCWTPHMVLHLAKILLSIDPPHWVTMTTRWLLMANAGINPFLYATGNVVIQRTLKCWSIPCGDSEGKYTVTDGKSEKSATLTRDHQNGAVWTF